MTDTLFRQAAAERADQMSARKDRPKQRRSAEMPGGRAVVGAQARISLRDADGDTDAPAGALTFDGIASATEQPYEMYDFFGPYEEVITAGAFAQSLNQKDLDCPLVIGHDQLRRIAGTKQGSLQLSEVDEGLRTLAPELDPTDADVQYITPKLRSGLIDEMSFGFRIDSGVWSPDYSQFRINQVNIHRGDVSIVGYGANPFTSGGLTGDAARAASDDQLRSQIALAQAELERRQPAIVPGKYTLGALHALTIR